MEFLAEDNVFDEHRLDFDAPAQGCLLNDLPDRVGNFFTTLDHILENAGTDNMAERSLCSLDQSLANVADAKGRFVGRCDAVVNDRRQRERDIVLGHADLLGHLDNLDLNVDLHKLLGERVDVDETRVDGACKTTKLGNKTYVALADGLVWVGTDDAAWNSAEGAHAAAEGVDLLRMVRGANVMCLGTIYHGTIPSVCVCISIIRLDDPRIAGL